MERYSEFTHSEIDCVHIQTVVAQLCPSVVLQECLKKALYRIAGVILSKCSSAYYVDVATGVIR